MPVIRKFHNLNPDPDPGPGPSPIPDLGRERGDRIPPRQGLAVSDQ